MEDRFAERYQNLRVLIADDMRTNLLVEAGLLKSVGVKADTASSGIETCRKMLAREYDVVFVDYLMPDMNAAELMSAYRRESFGRIKQPVMIAVSSDISKDYQRECIQAGYDDILVKPLKIIEVEKCLDKAIEQFNNN